MKTHHRGTGRQSAGDVRKQPMAWPRHVSRPVNMWCAHRYSLPRARRRSHRCKPRNPVRPLRVARLRWLWAPGIGVEPGIVGITRHYECFAGFAGTVKRQTVVSGQTASIRNYRIRRTGLSGTARLPRQVARASYAAAWRFAAAQPQERTASVAVLRPPEGGHLGAVQKHGYQDGGVFNCFH
jgi:hypothetical protein